MLRTRQAGGKAWGWHMKDKLRHDPAADYNLPRAHMPCEGDTIKLDGSMGEAGKA